MMLRSASEYAYGEGRHFDAEPRVWRASGADQLRDICHSRGGHSGRAVEVGRVHRVAKALQALGPYAARGGDCGFTPLSAVRTAVGSSAAARSWAFRSS